MNSHLTLMFTKHVHPAFGIIIINIMDAIFLVPSSAYSVPDTVFHFTHIISNLRINSIKGLFFPPSDEEMELSVELAKVTRLEVGGSSTS